MSKYRESVHQSVRKRKSQSHKRQNSTLKRNGEMCCNLVAPYPRNATTVGSFVLVMILERVSLMPNPLPRTLGTKRGFPILPHTLQNTDDSAIAQPFKYHVHTLLALKHSIPCPVHANELNGPLYTRRRQGGEKAFLGGLFLNLAIVVTG